MNSVLDREVFFKKEREREGGRWEERERERGRGEKVSRLRQINMYRYVLSIYR